VKTAPFELNPAIVAAITGRRRDAANGEVGGVQSPRAAVAAGAGLETAMREFQERLLDYVRRAGA
jgi:hypothetical protein